MKKRCAGPCGRTLSLERFHRAGRKRDGSERYHARCKDCANKGYRPTVTRHADALSENVQPTRTGDPEIAKIVQLAKHGIAFSDLCDRLDLSPYRARKLIERAVEARAPIHVEHDTITVAPSSAIPDVQEVAISAVASDVITVGAISDTHLGSKYCLRGAIRETIHWLYEQGARDIVHSGDVLEGCYRHAQYELSHVGFDTQLGDAAKCFPRLDGLRYHFISGNHDFTFEEKIGMRIGIAIEHGMRALGRDDWIAYGDRNAFLRVGGAVINLWHPRGSPAYSRSYVIQKRVEGYTAIKPHILLCGHYHQYVHCYERGIHGIMMPAFQGSGSNFAQSLRGPPSIGGLLLQWQLSDTGRLHNFRLHPRFFYERESIFEARNELDAQEIPAVGRDRRYRSGKTVE